MQNNVSRILCLCVALLPALRAIAVLNGQAMLSGDDQDALIIINLVNAAETDSFRVHGRYLSFSNLVDSGQLDRTAGRSPESQRVYQKLNLHSAPQILEELALGMILSSEGRAYKISLVHTRERCGFSLFSDESGIVYKGTPLICVSEDSTGGSGKQLPDVNVAAPTVNLEAPCPVSEVLEGAAKNAQELVDNLQRFTARERIEDITKGRNGKDRLDSDATFEYMAQMEAFSGIPIIEEYRSTTHPSDSFKPRVFDTGTAAFALLFHPKYIADFAVKCEGKTEIHSQPTWLIDFSQQPHRSNMFHVYRVGKNNYPVKLKGRAWISTDKFEVLRLETDLIEPIDGIRLQREHSSVEYAPIEFSNRNARLWLPQLTELDIDLQGHHYERRHTFSHFQLFSVDTEQEIKGAQRQK